MPNRTNPSKLNAKPSINSTTTTITKPNTIPNGAMDAAPEVTPDVAPDVTPDVPANGNAARPLAPYEALRARAEKTITLPAPKDGQAAVSGLESITIDLSQPNVTQRASHELQVHQIELELQNEELRNTQAALEISRARYFDLYDMAPIGYCTVGKSGLILEANFAAATLFGMPCGKVVGERFTRFIATKAQDSFYLRRTQPPESGHAQSMDIQMVQRSGTPFWANLTFTVIEQPQISVDTEEVRIAISDISSRKRAEQIVRENEANYRHLFNLIDQGFCVLELIFDAHNNPIDYRFVEANPAFEKQSGLTQVVGKCMSDIAPTSETHWVEVYGKVARTGKPVRLVSEAKQLGRWFDVYAFRIGDMENGKVAVLFNNITEQRTLDAERLDLNRLLADKNTNLEVAMQIAEKANQAKSDFLSSMSHELRTPLGAILGFAQLLDSGTPPPTPTQKRSVDQILQAGWYLLELINEILDLALIESGKLSLSIEPISLTQAMQECQTMVAPQAEKRNIGITFPSTELVHYAHADLTRVKQVLINLLSNAIKYNKDGGSVVVRCITSSGIGGSGNGRIRLCVEDTGDGLTAAQMAHLFQPFNRLGREAAAEEGTGIGLVVCKRLVELMGGTIGVDSIVGQGSVFWFELNLAPTVIAVLPDVSTLAPAPAPPAAAPVAPPIAAAAGVSADNTLPHDALAALQKREEAVDASLRALGSVRTLLYVEDNPANLMLVEEIVSRMPNVKLLSAPDGKTGLALARSTLPDAILMDINLPGMSGLVVLEKLLADPITAHIPVIALSANAMPYDIENGLGLGFYRYLTKPLKVPEFLATLDLALALQSSKLAVAAHYGKPEQAAKPDATLPMGESAIASTVANGEMK